MPAHKRRAFILSAMFTNVFLENLDDYCEDPKVYTPKDVDEAIEQFNEELKEQDETT